MQCQDYPLPAESRLGMHHSCSHRCLHSSGKAGPLQIQISTHQLFKALPAINMLLVCR